ncbi:DNA-binding transcriptional activator of the SARP family [Actinokineospora alba]|uniref:DNA-binding transcriptional activator of the SARP family n=1 Tax=Actinokineospora alba TaxID=504798 RepID=A0A1H0LQU3_9PSEU|nr:BTAD domain-containing putative transcriptional regulator [Actinokineospora alba]TDP67414.1 DNA-binding SARP family transcriptional activator [Actinokineospora alba]SDI97362.1 DNA-binding transcriptional activator of the SARP family [Actinokineospora alba]SDO70453.1 DNA-binding transcriptional activator of the SARP family [Actinokineospora alba]
MGAVEYRLLGPVEVVADSGTVAIGGNKPKALLATLLLEHGRVVSVERLVEVLWPREVPPTARAGIQTYVKSLRRALAEHGAVDVIHTRPPGYLIRVPADALDVTVFVRQVTAARSADPAAAGDLLRGALALWRGQALEGIDALSGEVARLDELWLTATADRIGFDLELGRHDELVPELAGLLTRFPAHERLRGFHMIALHRCGRQAEALASFETARAVLDEELGVRPGPELSAVHVAILRGAATPRAARVPRQVPLVPPDFTGRDQEIETLVDRLLPGRDRVAHPIEVITGPGGGGKSTLAARVAGIVGPRFRDGQLYAELRGVSDSPAHPGEVLGRFLRALGVPADQIPQSTAERSEVYRELLVDRRVLVLLDGARDERQITPLLPGGSGCAVMVTSRESMTGLAGANRLDLDVLDAAAGRGLLGRIVGDRRVAAEPDAADRIVERCGGLPLALRVAGARLASRQRWPLAVLADRLADERRRLDELSTADLAVRTSVEFSYLALPPLGRAALRRLGFLGVPEFGSWVVAWLLGIPESAADDIVEHLVDTHLAEFTRVDELGCLRYRLHDLVRIYAHEAAEREESAADLVDAVSRVLGSWLSILDKMAGDSPPDEIQWRLPAVATPPVSPAMIDLAMATPQSWFEIEQPAVVVGVERAAGLGLHALVCGFAAVKLGPSFLGVNRFESRERINAAAMAAARQSGDRRGEAMMLTELAHVRYLQDRYIEAREGNATALRMFGDLGDRHGQAVALAGLGAACRESGRLAEGLCHLDRAADLLRELGEDAGVAYTARMAGSVRLELGEFDQAGADLAEALAAYRQVGSTRGEALTLRTISLRLRALGEYPPAIEAARRAVELFQTLGDRLMWAYSVRAKAKAELRLGVRASVRAELDWALGVCEALADRWGQAVTLRTIGELHLADGHLADAERALTAAMAIWSDMDVPLWRARTERDFAALYRARGDSARADSVLADAMATFAAYGAREAREPADDPAVRRVIGPESGVPV